MATIPHSALDPVRITSTCIGVLNSIYSDSDSSAQRTEPDPGLSQKARPQATPGWRGDSPTQPAGGWTPLHHSHPVGPRPTGQGSQQECPPFRGKRAPGSQSKPRFPPHPLSIVQWRRRPGSTARQASARPTACPWSLAGGTPISTGSRPTWADRKHPAITRRAQPRPTFNMLACPPPLHKCQGRGAEHQWTCPPPAPTSPRTCAPRHDSISQSRKTLSVGECPIKPDTQGKWPQAGSPSAGHRSTHPVHAPFPSLPKRKTTETTPPPSSLHCPKHRAKAPTARPSAPPITLHPWHAARMGKPSAQPHPQRRHQGGHGCRRQTAVEPRQTPGGHRSRVCASVHRRSRAQCRSPRPAPQRSVPHLHLAAPGRSLEPIPSATEHQRPQPDQPGPLLYHYFKLLIEHTAIITEKTESEWAIQYSFKGPHKVPLFLCLLAWINYNNQSNQDAAVSNLQSKVPL